MRRQQSLKVYLYDQRCLHNSLIFYIPGRNALDLGSSPTQTPERTKPEDVLSQRSQATPSHWSPSPSPGPGTSPVSGPEDTIDELLDVADRAKSSPKPSFPMPTPAQRPKPPPTGSSPSKPSDSYREPTSSIWNYPPTSPGSPGPMPLLRKRSKKSSFNPGIILVPNSDSSQSQSRTQSLPNLPSQSTQASQAQKFSQSLSYTSDSQVHYAVSQNKMLRSSQVQKLPAFTLTPVSSSQAPQPPTSEARDRSLLQLAKAKATTSVSRSPFPLRKSPDRGPSLARQQASRKSSARRRSRTQNEVESESDEISPQSDTKGKGKAKEVADNSIDTYADDERLDHSSSDSPMESDDRFEEPEYVDEDVDDARNDDSALDSDDARTDAFIRRTEVMVREQPQKRTVTSASKNAEANITSQSPTTSKTPKRTRQGDRRSSVRSGSSETPALPLSPDVFLNKGSLVSASAAGVQTSRRSSLASSKHSVHEQPVTSKAPAKIHPIPQPTASTNRLPPKKDPPPATSSNHDVDMWRAPTFMRGRAVKEISLTEKRSETAKRPLSRSSSAAMEEVPTKRRRTDSNGNAVREVNFKTVPPPPARSRSHSTAAATRARSPERGGEHNMLRHGEIWNLIRQALLHAAQRSVRKPDSRAS